MVTDHASTFCNNNNKEGRKHFIGHLLQNTEY